MKLRVPLAGLAAILGGEARPDAPATVDLPADRPAWFGRTPECPIQPAEALAPGHRPAVVRVTAGRAAPNRLPAGTPVIRAAGRVDEADLRASLDRHLPLLIPGTLVTVDGCGVLLRGPAGSGKSETALGLLDRGHRLVADDAVALTTGADGRLAGRAPAGGGGRLLVRGLGPVTLHHQFPGGQAQAAPIDLTVTITPDAGADPLHGAWGHTGLMGRAVTAIALRAGRNLPLLVEVAVREQHRARQGHDPVGDIIEWQRDRLA